MEVAMRFIQLYKAKKKKKHALCLYVLAINILDIDTWNFQFYNDNYLASGASVP